jgi:subtilisin
LRNQAPSLEAQDPIAFNDFFNNARQNELVNAPEAWAQSYTGTGQVVAVVDTGIQVNHPDLDNALWQNPGEVPSDGVDNDNNGLIDDIYGWRFVAGAPIGDSNIADVSGHGTAVAGVIAAESAVNGSYAVQGNAYGAKIMTLKVGDASGNLLAMAKALIYAADKGATAINLSLGGPQANPDRVRPLLDRINDL